MGSNTTDDSFVLENQFLWTSPPDRLAKWIGHWEIWKQVTEVPGDIVEVGVHKGASLIRWLTFREISGGSLSRSIVGFDMFGPFPPSDKAEDSSFVDGFVAEAGQALSRDELLEILQNKGLGKRLHLVEGDALETIPNWTATNPDKRIALLHVDVDTYEPTKVALAEMAHLVSPGGIVLLDDYGKFPGETLAWEEFTETVEGWKLRKSPFHAYMTLAQRIT